MSDKKIVCVINLFTYNNLKMFLVDNAITTLLTEEHLDDGIPDRILHMGQLYSVNKFSFRGDKIILEDLIDEMCAINALEYNNQNIEIEVI